MATAPPAPPLSCAALQTGPVVSLGPTYAFIQSLYMLHEILNIQSFGLRVLKLKICMLPLSDNMAAACSRRIYVQLLVSMNYGPMDYKD